ncbi:tripartite tricarboxylate transporter permease [Martelella lutilitoris]|uniref:Tripartite tricarboxylate transporter permease n=1 Tax=Martelella lutilitoris TaxID=2583532 RepID=A0A7T7HIM2_9HYPH|nr:tripartite tricarboxylate transporter permease [Martelella lutilitoris]
MEAEVELFSNLSLGFHMAFSLTGLLYCFVGVFLGTLIGVLPGIGALTTISLLLPLTFYLEPLYAIVMIAGVYNGSAYGGSTASILLNLPGTPSSVVSCLDGHPMTKQGRAGVALFITTIASFFGAMSGLVLLAAFTPVISSFGLMFGPQEYFAVMLLGLVAASSLAINGALKGLCMVAFGVLLGTIGTDVTSGVIRYGFGISLLMEGFGLVVLAMGVFGLAEIIGGVHGREGRREVQSVSLRSMLPTKQDWRRSLPAMGRGAGLGGFLGALPGVGSTIASFMAYALEKKVSRTPERFGHGAIEGLSGPESANNAAVQTAFIPTLSLGIPGDPVMALVLGALIINGVQPGPLMLSEQPALFWGLIASFINGNILLVILNLPLIGMWVALLRIPQSLLFPAIVVFMILGAYSVNSNTGDIFLLAAAGALGYALSLLRFEPAPMLLGFILGPLMEEELRRSLLLSRGDPMTFLHRPISGVVLLICLLFLALNVWRGYSRMRRKIVHKRSKGTSGETAA